MNFDLHAHNYDANLEKGLSLSGENKEFFARGRLEAVRELFQRRHISPRRIAEFGCGIGTNAGIIRELWPECVLIGLDRSEESLSIARDRLHSPRTRFMTPERFAESGEGPVDWVFCNGVFHHIPPEERDLAFRFVRDLLCAGGVFTLFENNPFNPGTHLVMQRIPFDRDAKLINPYRVTSILSGLDFDEVSRRFLFVFPRTLSFLRPLEPLLSGLPIGAQYGVFAFRGAAV